MRPDDDRLVPFDRHRRRCRTRRARAELADAGERARADGVEAPRDRIRRRPARAACWPTCRSSPRSHQRPAERASDRWSPCGAVRPAAGRARASPPATDAPAGTALDRRWRSPRPSSSRSSVSARRASCPGRPSSVPATSPARPCHATAGTSAADARPRRSAPATSSRPTRTGSPPSSSATSRVRLDGGTADRASIDAAADRVDLEQIDRPRLASGRRDRRPAYAVRTADVTWTADGTAFDLPPRDGPGDRRRLGPRRSGSSTTSRSAART